MAFVDDAESRDHVDDALAGITPKKPPCEKGLKGLRTVGYWWVNQNQTYRHEVQGGYPHFPQSEYFEPRAAVGSPMGRPTSVRHAGSRIRNRVARFSTGSDVPTTSIRWRRFTTASLSRRRRFLRRKPSRDANRMRVNKSSFKKAKANSFREFVRHLK